jgi:hypothetical protein
MYWSVEEIRGPRDMHGLLFLWRIAKSECHMCIHPTGPQTQEKEKLPRNGSELVTYAEAYPCLVVQLFPSRSLLHSIINPYIYIYIYKENLCCGYSHIYTVGWLWFPTTKREGGGRSIGHGVVLLQQINGGENHSAVLL